MANYGRTASDTLFRIDLISPESPSLTGHAISSDVSGVAEQQMLLRWWYESDDNPGRIMLWFESKLINSKGEKMSTATEKKRAGFEGVRGKGYPAPKELATPTDLSPEEVQRIVEAVNPLIADAFALYTKTKNFHWHLAGSHFRDYHLLLDEQAEGIFESIDPLAERVRRIGGTTIRSISHIGQLQTIEDDNSDFVPAGEMVKRLMEDNGHMAKLIRDAIEICDKNRDSATSNALQQILHETERRKWFL